MKTTVFYDVRLSSATADANGSRIDILAGGDLLSLPAESNHVLALHARLSSGELPDSSIGLARLLPGRADGRGSLYCFEPYPDQSLRRAPELDSFEYHPERYNTNCIGWRNSLNPYGFLAPKGIVPGYQGAFISDSSEAFEVDLPYEFTDLCIRLRQDPVTVLRDFAATACKLLNTPDLPRADGLRSQGTVAEAMIEGYLEAAYGKLAD